MSRNLIQILFNNFRNSLRRPPPPAFVGEDHLGNKYFEFIPDDYHSSRRKKRTVEPVDTSIDYELPFEWEAWLRWKRREPPTQEEIDDRIARQAQAVANAKQFDQAYAKPTLERSPSEFPRIGRDGSQPRNDRIRNKDTIEE